MNGAARQFSALCKRETVGLGRSEPALASPRPAQRGGVVEALRDLGGVNRVGMSRRACARIPLTCFACGE
ncbi:MAG: hypothetical protein ACK58T_45485, partial [Phycisphaerae bacterium]